MEHEHLIKKFLETFFKCCHISNYEIDIKKYESENKVFVNVNIPMKASLFIGKFGSNLEAFEIIICDMINLNNSGETSCKVEFDINGYRSNRRRDLQDLARATAQKVMVFKAPVSLEPMSSRDRKIIHNEIALYPDLVSVSEDNYPYRHIVVSYLK